ncbi:hypothetical protein [Actinoplanes derwentensis]|uniref:Uncharacterized protein n=1 Tax=Actinoplanes derwentensis TaxID=113562 RepID=A0A1H2D8A3_9ACTN|nr:hypothetical protein [Actinoplanes derwentensis]GID86349.1 hypothetical protein Ade03nite_52730 [Actinoplanes derwentensis]SDT78985.1 hypothetical protein SAMN04489716_8597 [Actinoplanes derwentensis]
MNDRVSRRVSTVGHPVAADPHPLVRVALFPSAAVAPAAVALGKITLAIPNLDLSYPAVPPQPAS